MCEAKCQQVYRKIQQWLGEGQFSFFHTFQIDFTDSYLCPSTGQLTPLRLDTNDFNVPKDNHNLFDAVVQHCLY